MTEVAEAVERTPTLNRGRQTYAVARALAVERVVLDHREYAGDRVMLAYVCKSSKVRGSGGIVRRLGYLVLTATLRENFLNYAMVGKLSGWR
jgi:hypothetical protein